MVISDPNIDKEDKVLYRTTSSVVKEVWQVKNLLWERGGRPVQDHGSPGMAFEETVRANCLRSRFMPSPTSQIGRR